MPQGTDGIPGAIPTERGCGRRIYGACYAELGVGPGGVPIEAFLIDAPEWKFLLEGPTIPAAGVHLVEVAGVWHIFDHVGSEHYATPPDFIEEAARFGISRRLQSTLDFSKLTRDSRLFLLHSRAFIENADAYAPWTCPTDKEHQHGRGEHCIGCCWADADVDGTALVDAATGQVEREMPSFRYRTMLGRARVPLRRRPEGIKSVYKRGIFMKVPLGRIVVVGQADDPDLEALTDKVNKADLSWDFVNE